MPPDGDVLMSAVDIFKGRGGETPLVYGMELPAAARAVAGIVGDESFLDLTAKYESEADARRWETSGPTSLAPAQQPAGHPGRVLGAAGADHADRDAAAVRVHLTATHDEVLRLMGVALRFLGG